MAASVMMAINGISSNVLGKDKFLKFVCGTDDNNGMFSSLFSFSVSLSLLMYSRILEHTHTHTHTYIHRSKVHCVGSTSRSFSPLLNILKHITLIQTGTDKCNRSFNVLDSYSKCPVLLLMTWGNKWSGEGSNAVVYVSPLPL